VCLFAECDGGLAGGASGLVIVVEQDSFCLGLHVQDNETS